MDNSKFISVGFKSLVNSNRIIAVVSPDSAPIKRIINDAKESKNLIDATYGRKTRSVVVMDSGHVLLSLIAPETIASRLSVLRDEEG
ncbi:MAG: DUF370 domain-containing protein [Clostridia bacterium]|nr:DUF370 domain-containing protein [Clostridia bacterium]MCI2013832.1 DUF370 domain-containing protein [Clostridia bacterium]